MNILQVFLETASDLLFLFVIFSALNIINNSAGKPTLKCTVISLILVCSIGLISYTILFTQTPLVQLIISLINQSKFCIAALITYKSRKTKILCTILIIQFFCELLSYTIQSIIPDEFRKKSIYVSVLTLCLIRILLLILFSFINRISRDENISKVFNLIPNHIFVLILMSCFFTSGLIYTADFATSRTESKIQLLKIFSLAVTFCVIAILISLLINVLLKKYYSDMNELLENQVRIQINHYEKREKINTEIRKFKHDYINHINCIKSLIKAEKYIEASEYLNNISAVFPADSFLYNTGNYISDAILSDKQENVRKERITISFSGTIPSFINNIDLCIILSNAVDNAIEASLAVENEKNIEVFGGYRHGYFILTVKNPTVNIIDKNQELPCTTKSDSLYHGIGLQNIKAAVKKYNGFMKIENKNNYFLLSLTFNNIK